MTRNLLKNPDGEDNLEFWELTENGGNEWKVEDMPGDCGHDFNGDVTKYFATSFHLCLKRQVIDLIEEGYSADQLDNQPAVKVEDWYCGRTDCGCTYQITVCLLDEGHEILDEMKLEQVTLDPDTDDCSWKQDQINGPSGLVHFLQLNVNSTVQHTFSDYGPGLRFISFEHGGQDSRFWEGWFGVRVTGSSVTIETTP